MHEFDLIQKYFTWDNPPSDVSIAVGDDAAVLDIPPKQQLVTSIDTLISGIHFPENTLPFNIGYKSLAVNLSDLAAMGATPKWFTLALTLPEINQPWLEGFSLGLKSLAQQHNCFLIGGDTTRGPLSISIQVMGLVDSGKALLRSGAQVGEKIYVTGTLGDGAAGLQNMLGKLELSNENSEFCQQRLNKPTPQLEKSQIIKAFATSCIDISDGLLQDLSHILEASDVGAQLDLSSLPFSLALKSLDKELAISFALSGGDDYELLFTIPEGKDAEFLKGIKGKVFCIGLLTNHKGQIKDKSGKVLSNKDSSSGYNHFHV